MMTRIRGYCYASVREELRHFVQRRDTNFRQVMFGFNTYNVFEHLSCADELHRVNWYRDVKPIIPPLIVVSRRQERWTHGRMLTYRWGAAPSHHIWAQRAVFEIRL